MASEWFVRGGGKVYGPLDPSKLKQLAADGKIGPQTEVAKAASGPWHPASKVGGLFAVATPSVSPPPPLPAEAASSPPTRRWYRRWWAVFLLYPFLAFMGCGIVIQLVVPKETLDRWKAEAEENSRKRAEQRGKDSKDIHPGFTAGFMTGALAARNGATKPSSAQLNAIARRAATEANVAEKDRSYWIYQFELAFPMGWRKGQ
jgi:hypothetical protein